MRKKGFKDLYRYFLAAATVALWILFAPVQLGGRASYIMVSGNSMEPNFHRGDLVITQKHTKYQIGEAVAYYDPLLEGVIYHRIVAQEQNGFLVQGDANSWLDSHIPTNEDILGAEWIYLPGAGNILEKARQPGWLATIVVAFVLMTVWPSGNDDLAGGPAGDPANEPEEDLDTHFKFLKGSAVMAQKQQVEELFYLSLAVGFLSILSLVFFFTKPSTEIIEKFSTLQHTGTFGYTAPAPTSVYDAGYAQTGEPIFRQVSNYLEVSFDYALVGNGRNDMDGEYRLMLEISDESGWRRIIELVPSAKFTGGEFSVKEKVWFYNVQGVIDDLKKATGVERSTYYLRIYPEVRVIASTVPLKVSTFMPSIGFNFTATEVLLRYQADEVINQKEDFILTSEDQKDASIKLLGMDIPVVIGRYISGVLLVMAACAVGGIRWYDNKMMIADDRKSLDYQFGDLIVDVNKIPAMKNLIEVNSLERLIRMAEMNRVNVLLHEAKDQEHFYAQIADRYYHFQRVKPPVIVEEDLSEGSDED